MNFKTYEQLKEYLLKNHCKDDEVTISRSELESLTLESAVEVDSLYENIFDAVPCTISVVNSEMEYIKVNSTLAQLCDLAPTDFIGNKVGFYTDNKFFFNFVKKLFNSSQSSISQEIKSTVNGIDHIFWVSANKINNSQEAVLIGVDITDIKRLEGQVQFNEKLTALGEMVAGIIHDIKNPLTVISGSAQMLKRLGPQNPEKLEKIAYRIEATSDRILKIVDSIKVFARTGEDDPFVKQDIIKIFDESVDICNHKFHQSHIDLKVVGRDRKFIEEVNETRIFQVFVNLLSNACDAINELEEIEKWVSVEFLPDLKQVKLRDCGKGIDPKVSEKIFSSFYTTKGVGVGSGLGLSNCKRIMQEHSGDIFVDHSDDNTCFVIQFASN
ncbi:ATP-binding protein [Halobacteriovorax sp. HLS]|uniref:ATP-binding protein n=1 Tax=Halobacteriovorax sp. HLS TaxID=2234000 RepID=UPI000FD9DD4E|nr:ATP-binding protein [Halobacteriovorax sp. HLS]